MKIRLADNLLQKLSELGQAIDIDRQTQVFDGGEVGIVENLNKKDEANEPERSRGSATGSWQGPEAGPRRAPGEAPRVGIVDQQVPRLAGLAELYKAYPTIIKEGDFGLWIIVTSKPLGGDGPQVTFVIAYPYSDKGLPKAWAFWKLGDFPKFIGPRHTNFPDASICAYGPQDGAWERADGLVALVDLYSTWALRHLYFQYFDRWPGRQYGASALYRRIEFSGEEWCGCGGSLKYAACHKATDALVDEEVARDEHRQTMGSDYGPRRPPKSVMNFARSCWRKIPSFRDAYEGR